MDSGHHFQKFYFYSKIELKSALSRPIHDSRFLMRVVYREVLRSIHLLFRSVHLFWRVNAIRRTWYDRVPSADLEIYSGWGVGLSARRNFRRPEPNRKFSIFRLEKPKSARRADNPTQNINFSKLSKFWLRAQVTPDYILVLCAYEQPRLAKIITLHKCAHSMSLILNL